jgi:methylthioribose-1-phosphate isomerase
MLSVPIMIKQSGEIRYLEGRNVPLTIWWDEEKKVVKLIDQTKLPKEVKVIECDNWKCMEEAIKKLRIRGAPALGAACAYALALEAQRFGGDEERFFRKMDEVSEVGKARPTAVNLMWGVNKVYDLLQRNRGTGIRNLKDIALREAGKIIEKDIEDNKKIGEHGLRIFEKWEPKDRTAFKILTHCNAGSLATGGYGTALGVIRAAFKKGIPLHVYVDETRPLLQGARITAWELYKEGIPLTLITDNSAGWVFKKENIDMVIVGADRITSNGNTANKIGTYSLSILAKEHKVPFYVAAPTSTIDPKITSGERVDIEERNHKEVTKFGDSDVAPFLNEDQVRNYAFDVTPHENIDGIITEEGIIEHPDKLKIGELLKRIGRA